MARRYGPNIRAYIEQHCGEGSLDWMRGEIRERFGVAMTYPQIKSYYSNHKLHAKRTGARKGQKTFPPEVAAYIEKNCSGKSYAEMCGRIRKRYGIEKTPQQMKTYYKNRGLHTGTDARFKPGHVSHNKGKKMPPEILEKCRATQFRKGNRPHNAQPVGTESKIDGYWKVKIEEPNVWQMKSRHEWERIHGEKLGADDVVIFLDNNQDNFEPDNLVRVTRAELSSINRDGLRGTDPDLNRTAVTLAKLKVKAAKKKRRERE